MVSPTYPKGDAGGNFISLPEVNGAKNLHSVWDSVLYEWTTTPTLPFTPSGWTEIGNAIARMEAKNTFSP
jgi:hypothetical protein